MSADLTLDPKVLETLRQLTTPGEPDVLAEILNTFLDDVPRRLDALTRAADAGQAAEAARVAHSLKGSAGNIGARRLQHLAGELEHTAKAGDTGALRDQAEALRGEYAALESEIRRVLAS